MDTILKYIPLVSASCAVFMVLWNVVPAVRSKMTSGTLQTEKTTTPWWKRQITIMIVLALLAWAPLIVSGLYQKYPFASRDVTIDMSWDSLTLPVRGGILIRPSIKPFKSIHNAHAVVDSVEHWSNGNWELKPPLSFPVDWACNGASVYVCDVDRPTRIALVGLIDGSAKIDSPDTKYDSYNGELTEPGKWRLHLTIFGENFARENFIILLDWYGGTDFAIEEQK